VILKIKSFNNIAVFSAYIPPYASGSGINAFNFVTELSSLGLSVKLYSFNWFAANKESEIADNFKIKRIRVLNNLIYRIYLLICYIPLTLKHKYFVFFGCFPGYLILMLLINIFGRRVVFRSTNLNSDDLFSIIQSHNLLKRGLSKFLISRLDLYYSLGDEFTARCLKVFPDFGNRIFESNQGVRMACFYPDNELREKFRRSLFQNGDGLIIISVGNLTKRKGYDKIFTTMSQLKIPFYYLVAGSEKVNKINYWQDSEEMSELYNLGSKVLNEKVQFTGFLDQSELVKYYHRSDVFLMNSVNEGLPNSLLEAMACGLVPLVNKDSGVAASVVSELKADLVFQGINDLKEKLFFLYHNVEWRKSSGNDSRAFALKNFDDKIVIKKLIEFCEREEK
jgi:glycosyltransferase involved in cell wall biosynthesis